MAVRFDGKWTFCGLRALILENEHLRVVILPELGAKIWSLIYKPLDREMLWHHPRLQPRVAPFGSDYEHWFSGGWDELFPNDAAVTIDGIPYPDHGELWSMPFEWELTTRSPQEIVVRLWRPGVVTSTIFEKWISLRQGEHSMKVRYRCHNQGPFPLDFTWKLHPALDVRPSSRIELPARRVIVDPGFRERLGQDVAEFQWPLARSTAGDFVDMRQIPPATDLTCDFFYAIELDEGWCALTDVSDRVGFGLVFDRNVFNYVTVFASSGGWRGLYTTILEPSTSYPSLLEDAMASGTHCRLLPGQTLQTEVTAVLYHGLEAVQRITPDGTVE